MRERKLDSATEELLKAFSVLSYVSKEKLNYLLSNKKLNELIEKYFLKVNEELYQSGFNIKKLPSKTKRLKHFHKILSIINEKG